MPFAQLLTSGIELGINQLLTLDPTSQLRLKKLQGKQLKVTVRELPWPLIFSFSDRIDVMTAHEGDDSPASHVDCHIELALETLPELKDSSKISQLIQQNKLVLHGDINVAQAFSGMLKELEIDWEEQLSQYTGDVFAHQTFASMKSVFLTAQQNMQQFSANLSETLMAEPAVAISADRVTAFCEQVNDLRSDAQRLEARLALLENQRQGSK